jgi:pimeloyl-ACP methyl ester carboxylesterase
MRSALVVVAAILACGCGGAPEVEVEDAAAAIEVESGYAEFGQSRIYYEVKGQGSPLILIHGGLLNRHMWDGQFDVFSQDHRVIRYDASSHGRSVTPPGAYYDHEDVAGLMEHLGIDRAVIMGLSFGGRVAIDFALEHPERVAAVVAVGSGLGGFRFDSEEVTAGRQELNDAWIQQDWDRVVEGFQRAWTDGPHRSPEDVDPGVRERVRVMIRETIMDRAASGQVAEGRTMDPPAIDRLHELEVPMLVVLGELDMPDIHEIGRLLTEANPNAERIVIEGVAHMVNMEKPDQFNRVVSGYLEEIGY